MDGDVVVRPKADQKTSASNMNKRSSRNFGSAMATVAPFCIHPLSWLRLARWSCEKCSRGQSISSKDDGQRLNVAVERLQLGLPRRRADITIYGADAHVAHESNLS